MKALRLSEKAKQVVPVVTTNAGEVQYMCTTRPHELAVHWNTLEAGKVWAVKNPGKQCIDEVMKRMKGCMLYKNPGTLIDLQSHQHLDDVLPAKPYFLLSPIAVKQYEFEPRFSETVIITCTPKVLDGAGGISPKTAFLLIKTVKAVSFMNVTTMANKYDTPGAATVRAVKQRLGLTISATWLKFKGTVIIKNKKNIVIERLNEIHVNVFSLHLCDTQVEWVLKYVQAADLNFGAVQSSYVNTLSTGSKFMLLLFSDFQDLKYMKSNVDMVHHEYMLRCYNKTLGPLPWLKSVDMKPFYAYKHLPLECVDPDI